MLLYAKKIHFIVPIKLKFDYFIFFILQLLLQKYGMQRDEFNNIYPHGTKIEGCNLEFRTEIFGRQITFLEIA